MPLRLFWAAGPFLPRNPLLILLSGPGIFDSIIIAPLKQNTNPQIADKWMNDDWFTAETDWKWNKVQAQSIPENAPILISSGIIILSLPDGAAT